MSLKISIGNAEIVFPCEQGETILDAAERAGYSIPYSCRKGVCSTCQGELNVGTAQLGSKSIEGPATDVLFCACKPLTDIVINPKRISRHDPAARKTAIATVYRAQAAGSDVVILQLRLPASIRAKFKAGQYLQVRLADGDTRNFSMANPPHESDGVQLHIRRVPGGRFSEEVLGRLKAGDKIEIELPFGDFFYRTESSRPTICIATGTGLAPFKSMVEDLIRKGHDKPMRLYWGGRRPEDLYLPDLPRKWTARAPWLSYIPVVSEASSGWDGATGLVHHAALRDVSDMSSWQVYACGNPLMIRNARREFVSSAGLPPDQFFADPFVPSGNTPATN